eukprot:TRINITY_DN65818_c0_g1_i1.p1 TRINITY_DN65818_c0_g1~~TRINITY_DN65818_c0_g1_i1.p1  ORF type:complete len:466 (+),score=106.27 TRINITY_DN65818_c0_g1_i1:68-1399(+)
MPTPDGCGPWCVAWARVRVRSAPGQDGEHVEWLTKGAEVAAAERVGSWLRLQGSEARWVPIDGAAAGMGQAHACSQLLVPAAEPAPHYSPAADTTGPAPDAYPAAGGRGTEPAPPRPLVPTAPGSPAPQLALLPPPQPAEPADRYRARWREHLQRCGGAVRTLQSVTRVWAVSDCHIDHKANMHWLEALGAVGADEDGIPFSSGAVIVAGDLCTGLPLLERGLRLFAGAFRVVCYCVGNHELWGAKPDSVEKFFAIMDLCRTLGVETGAVDFGGEVCVVPLQSWYKSDFLPGPVTSTVEHFDGGCSWPEGVADPGCPSNSLHDGIADFFLSLNDAVVPAACGAAEAAGADVVSFSHFIPRPELYRGYPSLGRVMGCHEIETAVRRLGSRVHVFGHSHLDVDHSVRGCRYLQNNLGYPRDRWGDPPLPAQVWPPVSPRWGSLSG